METNHNLLRADLFVGLTKIANRLHQLPLRDVQQVATLLDPVREYLSVIVPQNGAEPPDYVCRRCERARLTTRHGHRLRFSTVWELIAHQAVHAADAPEVCTPPARRPRLTGLLERVPVRIRLQARPAVAA